MEDCLDLAGGVVHALEHALRAREEISSPGFADLTDFTDLTD